MGARQSSASLPEGLGGRDAGRPHGRRDALPGDYDGSPAGASIRPNGTVDIAPAPTERPPGPSRPRDPAAGPRRALS